MTRLKTALGRAGRAIARLGRPAPAAPANGPSAERNSGRGWEMIPLDDLTAASDLLDCLENQGVREAELVVLNEVSFVARWRRTSLPPHVHRVMPGDF